METSTRPNAELQVDPDGTIHVQPYTLPLSPALSEHARTFLAASLNRTPRMSIPFAEDYETEADFKAMVDGFRANIDEAFAKPMTEMLRAVFPVNSTIATRGGVPVEEFTPVDGVDTDRVLINLHGGAFYSGATHVSRIESIPMANLGKFRVVSVDYRQGYEHKFPAASEDIAAVYESLLADYAPGQIGIYGGSAGGVLTAQATAWIIDKGLPVPGAIGIFGAGTGGSGDSAWFSAIGMGLQPPFTALATLAGASVGYFSEASDEDPLVNPNIAPLEFRAQFPPTLLVTATRAFDLSPAIATHRALVQAGVDASLHVFDGHGHCFYYDAMGPEGRDAYDTMIGFFRCHLGSR